MSIRRLRESLERSWEITRKQEEKLSS